MEAFVCSTEESYTFLVKFLDQVLYPSYYLFYLQQICMDGTSGPTYGL